MRENSIQEKREPISNNTFHDKLNLRIGGMQCSFCVESINKAIERQEGVISVGVNLAHQEAIIEYDTNLTNETSISNIIKQLGYNIKDKNRLKSLEEDEEELIRHKNKLYQSGCVALIALVLMLLMWTGIESPWFKWIMLTLTILMIFGVGLFILKMGYQSLKRGILNQHVLMEFGAVGGFVGGLIGIIFELPNWPTPDFFGAAIFITAYHILSGYTSLLVRNKTSQAVTELLKLQPSKARKLEDKEEIEVDIDKIEVGDKIKVLPGESIPLDGKVIKGQSIVDESIVTGEPIGRTKRKGDEVIGGSINFNGALIIEVSATSDEGFLQQVIRSIEEARSLKPGILQLVEKVLKYFVPSVLIIAVVSFAFWTVGWFVITGSPDYYRAYFASLAVLVMGYPCALGMATPLAMIKGGGEAAQQGILMKSSSAFQVIKDLHIIAFDKTGTITEGKPEVISVYSVNNKQKEMILLAASLENLSEHPLAKAIVSYSNSIGFHEKISDDVANFEAISGKGVTGEIDGDQVLVGNPRLMKENNIDLLELQKKIEEYENKGWTTIVVSRNRKALGILGITDKIKEDARDTITALHKLGFQTVLITGDNRTTAIQVAKEVGISDLHAEVLPYEKAEIIRKLQKGQKVVAMVGDGINDGPALMQANIGIAFGSGTDIAIEAADIVVMRNQLSSLLDTYIIGRKSYKKTQQNVALAFTFNGIGVPLAAIGLIQQVFAMIAMAASVTTVLTNSLSRGLFNTDFTSNVRQENTHSIELDSDDNVKRRDNESIYAITKFNVPTINCIRCVNNLTELLTVNSAIKGVTGNSDLKILEIVYDKSKIDNEKITKLIEAANHSVLR